jgi:hypothetical protein
MKFQRSCLYHPVDGLRVIEEDQEDEYNRLLKTGVWFDHPNKAKEMRIRYEKKSHGKRAYKKRSVSGNEKD